MARLSLRISVMRTEQGTVPEKFKILLFTSQGIPSQLAAIIALLIPLLPSPSQHNLPPPAFKCQHIKRVSHAARLTPPYQKCQHITTMCSKSPLEIPSQHQRDFPNPIWSQGLLHTCMTALWRLSRRCSSGTLSWGSTPLRRLANASKAAAAASYAARWM